MPTSLKSKQGGSTLSIGQTATFSSGVPDDFTDTFGARYLRSGVFELDTSKFNNSFWANSLGTLWRSVFTLNPESNPTNGSPCDCKFLNNRFILLRRNVATQYTSTDGVSWTTFTAPTTGGDFYITYGAGLYVLVNNQTNGNIWTSSDLATWTPRTLPSTITAKNVAFLNNVFFITGIDRGLMTSTDGISWTARNSAFPTGHNVNSIAFGGGTYVIVGGQTSPTGAYSVASSSDGFSWTLRTVTTTLSTAPLTDVVYSNKFFAYSKNTNSKCVFYSTNGTTWDTTISSVIISGAVAFLNSKFYQGGNQSVDGINWTPISIAGIGSDPNSESGPFYCFGNSKLVCAGIQGGTPSNNSLLQISLSQLSAGTTAGGHVRIS